MYLAGEPKHSKWVCTRASKGSAQKIPALLREGQSEIFLKFSNIFQFLLKLLRGLVLINHYISVFSNIYANLFNVFQKYLSFQWENHSRSIKLEAVTFETIKNRITVRSLGVLLGQTNLTSHQNSLPELLQEKVNAAQGTWIDWQYLFDAAKLLAKCRSGTGNNVDKIMTKTNMDKVSNMLPNSWQNVSLHRIQCSTCWYFLRYTLQYTYPYAYYIEPCPRKELVCC